MDTHLCEAFSWAHDNFSGCDFSDKRITNRMVRFAEQCAIRPNETTPHQTQEWRDCKAAYRLMSNKKVSFQSIIAPHCKRTRERAQEGVFLSICDTTEVSFSLKRKIASLGKTGDNIGRGFFLHSSLLKSETTGEILGLAAQDLSYRIPAIKGETKTERLKRSRNSEVWGRVVQEVGCPQAAAKIIHVCDRGADHYEFFAHCVLQKAGWVTRVQHLTRKIVPCDASATTEPGKEVKKQGLLKYLEAQEVVGKYELKVAATKNRPARLATVEVRIGNIWMPRPSYTSPWLKQNGPKFIKMGVVLAREVVAQGNTSRKGTASSPLQWVLCTEEPLVEFVDGRRVLGRYEERWVIEDYHKAAKTGCQIEHRLYRTNKRLERVVGVLSVLAARIVGMKEVAKSQPNRKAIEVAPKRWVTLLCKLRRASSPKTRDQWRPSQISISQFVRGLAMLGGFLGRKSDGDPGWITIWRGVKELMLVIKAKRQIRG